MANRRLILGSIVLASLFSSPAWADQEVALQLPGLKVVVPDGWVYEVGEGAEVFKDAGGTVIGKIVVAPEPCSDATARIAFKDALKIVDPIVDPLQGWSGWNYVKDGAPIAIQCRAAEIMGVPLQFLLVGYSPDSGTLLRAFHAGLDARVDVQKAPEAVATPRDPTTLDGVATHEVQLATLETRILVPADWNAGYSEYYDWITRADGTLVAKVGDWGVGCAERIATAGNTAVTPSVEPSPGWTAFEDGGRRAYCRDFVVRGKPWSAYVQVDPGVASWLVPAVDEALTRYVKDQIPTLFERFGPTRSEFGFARFDEDPHNLFAEARWGASVAIGRMPFHQLPGLTWSYQARLAATPAGFPGSAEVGGGLNLQVIALQAIAGLGGAGGPAPLGVHAGGQFDLLFLKRSMFDGGGGFDFSVSRVWRTGGTATRMQGGFVVSMKRTGLSLCMGWESRMGTQLITINAAFLTLPEL